MYNISSITNKLKLGILHLPDFAELMSLEGKREIEKGGTLFLLKKLLLKKPELAYTAEGKPYLLNETVHISITHSHDKLAILLHDEESVGIDIELIRDKVLKIKHKFLSPSELIHAGDDVQLLITYWACKEALYKLYSKKEVDFIEHLFIHPFDKKENGTIIGEVRLKDFCKKVNLQYTKTEDYMLVYTLNEIK